MVIALGVAVLPVIVTTVTANKRKKLNTIGKLPHFPIQKLAKTLPNKSSVVTTPVTSPK
jgi:hypothetical protein